MLACWHSLQQLHSLGLIGLAFTAADTSHLTAFLAAGSAATLTSLVLGDQQGLSFLSDNALEGLGSLLGPSCRLKVLDLSGCIELTDAGEGHSVCVYGCQRVWTDHTVGESWRSSTQSLWAHYVRADVHMCSTC